MVITTDIELLEVFYAHTISPIMIAVIMSVIMVMFIGSYHAVLGVIAAVAYLFVGAVVPVIISKSCGRSAEAFRRESGSLNSFVLENLYGISELIQYGMGSQRIDEMKRRTEQLSEKESMLKRSEGINFAITTAAVVVFPLIMLAVSGALYSAGAVGFDGVIIPTVAMFSSFGPVIALANLGGGLQQTFAAADRVLDILDEQPSVPEISGGADVEFNGAAAENVTFSYGDDVVLDGVSAEFPSMGSLE